MRRALAVGAALVAVAGCGDKDSSSNSPADTPERASSAEQVVTESGFNAQKIYKDESQGVVTIQSLFGREGGEGSGFVINDEGEIVTNAHVVTTGEGGALKRASEVYVEFADGNRVSAKVLGHDPNADIALLRVETDGLDLRAAAAGRQLSGGGRASRSRRSARPSDRPGRCRSGSSPRSTATSRPDRVLDRGRDPDRRGDQPRQLGRAAGRFRRARDRDQPADPVALRRRRGRRLRGADQRRQALRRPAAREGRARYAYLGVTSVPLYPQLVEHFKLDVDKGAWLQTIEPGGPAASAGLRGGSGREVFQGSTFARGGDVITKIGDTEVEDADDLSERDRPLQAGRDRGHRDPSRRRDARRQGQAHRASARP